MAVFILPPEMLGFYKKNIEYITEHAVDPDKRRYANKQEAPRHFLDSDRYGAQPFETIPRRWNDAVAKFTEDTLLAHGIVPWHIHAMIFRLTEAFKEENLDKILYLSADIGHYIADANVPLHTTKNYNGQLTDQVGIHAFWESRLPELYAENYDFFTGKAEYIKQPLDYAWNTVETSYAAKDSVLQFEAGLNKTFPPVRKYAFDKRGRKFVKVYSEEYSLAYHQLLDGMVERRMRAAVKAVGSFWYTAWVNAGKPDLRKFYDKDISEELKIQLIEEELESKSETILKDSNSLFNEKCD